MKAPLLLLLLLSLTGIALAQKTIANSVPVRDSDYFEVAVDSFLKNKMTDSRNLKLVLRNDYCNPFSCDLTESVDKLDSLFSALAVCVSCSKIDVVVYSEDCRHLGEYPKNCARYCKVKLKSYMVDMLGEKSERINWHHCSCPVKSGECRIRSEFSSSLVIYIRR